MTELEMKQMTKLFFSLLTQQTQNKIDIDMINHDTLLHKENGKCIHIAKAVDIKEAFSVLVKENAWWKNMNRKENLYFRFAKDQQYDIAFVDDIVNEHVERFMKKNHFLLIQTSSKKYQGLFKLSKPVSWQELKYIQKALCNIYQGDPASTDASHLRRIIGFVNTKYNDNFIVKLTHIGSNTIDVDEIMSYIRKHMREQDQKDRKLQSRQSGKIEKTWQDFYDGKDESRADMSYALYLLRKGLSENEIRERLRNESLDLKERKGSRVENYLTRTIDKALSYIGHPSPC